MAERIRDKTMVGDKIKVQSKLARREGYKNYGKSKPGEPADRRWYKRWDVIDIPPREVMFLGNRTLSNGWKDYIEDCGFVYEADEYVKAALVIRLDGRTNPFYVPRPEKSDG